MTPLRQGFHAALVLAGLCVALPSRAQQLAPIGPPTAADAAAATQAAPVEKSSGPTAAPVGSVATPPRAPNWLASRPAPKPQATGRSSLPSTGRILGLLLVVGSLGGAAFYLKRRTRADSKRALPPQRLAVLSSARIGPKAHAVVISVAGRQMLLGVTDASVKRLAFIDEVEDEQREPEPARRANPPNTVAARVRAAAPETARAGSFTDLLKTAFGQRPPVQSVDAASILARETRDLVGGKPAVPAAPNVRMLDVEGQAQGLVRRLSGPRA